MTDAQVETQRRGIILFEHIADMLQVLKCAEAMPQDIEITALAEKTAERLRSILAAVDLLTP